MPSPLIHIAAGYFISKARAHTQGPAGSASKRPSTLLWITAISIIPDLDAVPGILLNDMPRFHNGYTHSLFVGLLAAILFASLASRVNLRLWTPWFWSALLAYELHIALDFFCGGRGQMLLWPVTAARYASPLRLFAGLRWGEGVFSIWHLHTLTSEVLFIAAAFLAYRLIRRSASRRKISEFPPGH